MLHIWDAERDLLCSGTAEEDLARYERWVAEHAIWLAVTAGQDDPPAATGRDT